MFTVKKSGASTSDRYTYAKDFVAVPGHGRLLLDRLMDYQYTSKSPNSASCPMTDNRLENHNALAVPTRRRWCSEVLHSSACVDAVLFNYSLC